MISKLMPWVLMIGGGYVERDKFQEAITGVEDIVKGAGTSSDMTNIVILITANSADQRPDPDTFCELVRRNMRSPVASKDVCDDFWNVPYTLTVGEHDFMVSSAGPDSEFDDDDDIVMAGDIPE